MNSGRMEGVTGRKTTEIQEVRECENCGWQLVICSYSNGKGTYEDKADPEWKPPDGTRTVKMPATECNVCGGIELQEENCANRLVTFRKDVQRKGK